MFPTERSPNHNVTSEVSVMAEQKVPPFPVYFFTIKQRAGLQLLGHAIEYIAGLGTQADLDAVVLLLKARERVLRAAEYEGPYIAWRNPKAGGQ